MNPCFPSLSRRQLMCSALMAALLFSLPATALAYIDPGTANILVQAVIGAIAAAAGTIAVFWSRIRGLFSSKKSDDKKSDNNSTQP